MVVCEVNSSLVLRNARFVFFLEWRLDRVARKYDACVNRNGCELVDRREEREPS